MASCVLPLQKQCKIASLKVTGWVQVDKVFNDPDSYLAPLYATPSKDGANPGPSHHPQPYRVISLIKNFLLLGPSSRPMPRALRWS